MPLFPIACFSCSSTQSQCPARCPMLSVRGGKLRCSLSAPPPSYPTPFTSNKGRSNPRMPKCLVSPPLPLGGECESFMSLGSRVCHAPSRADSFGIRDYRPNHCPHVWRLRKTRRNAFTSLTRPAMLSPTRQAKRRPAPPRSIRRCESAERLIMSPRRS